MWGRPQESLRKYSVVPVVTRRCAADDEMCGHRIPAGTYLACSIQARHLSSYERRSHAEECLLNNVAIVPFCSRKVRNSRLLCKHSCYAQCQCCLLAQDEGQWAV